MKKKTTLATIKSFVKREKNNNNLYIKVKSGFDGMVDCVMPVDDGFGKVKETTLLNDNTLGMEGAWFVGGNRDYFDDYADDNFIGYLISNCCGSFIIAMKRLY